MAMPSIGSYGRAVTTVSLSRPPWSRSVPVRWLATVRFDHAAHQIILQECIDAITDAEQRRDRMTAQIEQLLPEWSLAPVVEALQAMRGVAFVTAATLVAEVGDFRRFATRASSWPTSASPPANIPAAPRPGAAASPKQAAVTRATSSSRVRGPIDCLSGSVPSCRHAWRGCRKPCARLLESPVAPVCPLQGDDRQWQAVKRRDHGDRSRDGRFHLGHRPQIAPAVYPDATLAHPQRRKENPTSAKLQACKAGGGARREPSVPFCGRFRPTPVTRQRQPRDEPTVLRYPTRASELAQPSSVRLRLPPCSPATLLVESRSKGLGISYTPE